MMFYNLKRKLRRIRNERRMRQKGYNYHHHWHEIVVSENELLIQIDACSNHDNLLGLLALGKSLENYEIRLMKASLKFEFLGSLVQPRGKDDTDKPVSEIYVRELFQRCYETIDEIKMHLKSIMGTEISDEFARNVFRKFSFIINTCCPIMAQSEEIWCEGTYRAFIEYAIECDDFDFPDEDNIWNLFPKDVPKHGQRKYVLDRMPSDFVRKIREYDTISGSIWY